MKTFLQYIFEGQVVPSPTSRAVPNDKRDDSNSDVYATPEQTTELKKYTKNVVNDFRLNRMKNYLSDPLDIKSGIQSAVDTANTDQEYQNMKDEDYRDQWGEQLPRDRDGNPLG